ncbi:hypothetical protein [Methanopyrus kandleri]|uniref:Uncharacterized protein n=2 Tax=Methanopyrus kandleri TaxID=2320 RepID=Q8TZ88_METKA|nr:hypothetical protein [Methanopyrus kandleri]AAM01267.1 Uncharacterized protein MK0050 [Methanopyrus kandleri AV19]HII70811.1 hypothetical protein [Methanopyrus kandleri]
MIRAIATVDENASYIAFVETPSANEKLLDVMSREKWRELGMFVLDHHGQLSEEPSAVAQAYEIVKEHTEFPLVRKVVIEPPVDADMVAAVLLLKQGPVLPEEDVEVLDKIDRFGKHYPSDEELESAEYALAIMQAVAEVVKKPYPDNPEELKETFKKALRTVERVVDDEKYREKLASKWLEEFRKSVREAEESTEVIEEGEVEVGNDRIRWCAAISEAQNAFTYLYREGYDLVVLYSPVMKRVTVGLADPELPIDLRELFEYLNEHHREGWGGRKNIGGSPKNYEIDEEEFKDIVSFIHEWLLRFS